MRKLLILAAISMVAIAAKAQKTPATIDHIAFYVQNTDSSASFYSTLFDLKIIANPFPGARVKWLGAGNGVQLHLVEGLKTPVTTPFMTHVCFSVVSLEEFMSMLDKPGIKYYSGPDMVRGINHRPDGVDQIFIKDPDNNWVEINNAKH